METLEEIKNLVSESKNICVIPSQNNEPESLTAALALFYTLKELGKNVNLVLQQLPETLQFLTPSMDYISQPKNFVIAIPKNVAEVSQVYYEKNDETLKIHLTIDKGSIKKDNLSFYFTDAKPDTIITLGIQNFQRELEGKLDSFGFLLESPIINIDSVTVSGATPMAQVNGVSQDNARFGKINLLQEKSLSEMALEVITSLNSNGISKNAAHCLLAGLTLHYENFQNPQTSPEIFQLCAQLMKLGADRQQILANLYKK